MTQDRKENITVCSAVAMLVFGCVLTVIGFFLEPMGEVHASVWPQSELDRCAREGIELL